MRDHSSRASDEPVYTYLRTHSRSTLTAYDKLGGTRVRSRRAKSSHIIVDDNVKTTLNASKTVEPEAAQCLLRRSMGTRAVNGRSLRSIETAYHLEPDNQFFRAPCSILRYCCMTRYAALWPALLLHVLCPVVGGNCQISQYLKLGCIGD